MRSNYWHSGKLSDWSLIQGSKADLEQRINGQSALDGAAQAGHLGVVSWAPRWPLSTLQVGNAPIFWWPKFEARYIATVDV